MVNGMPLMTQPSPTLRCRGIENEVMSVVIVSSRKSMRGVTLFTPLTFLDEDISLFGISLKGLGDELYHFSGKGDSELSK